MNLNNKKIKERIRKSDELRKEMKQKGYTENCCLIDIKKAQVTGFAVMMPFVIVAFMIYSIRWKENRTAFDMEYMDLIIFILGMFVYIIIHEFIHGFTWTFYCKKICKVLSLDLIRKIFFRINHAIYYFRNWYLCHFIRCTNFFHSFNWSNRDYNCRGRLSYIDSIHQI